MFIFVDFLVFWVDGKTSKALCKYSQYNIPFNKKINETVETGSVNLRLPLSSQGSVFFIKYLSDFVTLNT